MNRGLRLFLIASSGAMSALFSMMTAASEVEPPSLSVPAITGDFTLAQENLSLLESRFVDNHRVLRVAVATIPFPPSQTITDGELGGHSITFLQKIAKANGFGLEFIFFDTWQEVLSALENRDADLTPVSGITQARREYLLFTRGITPDPSGIVGKISDDRLRVNPQLKGLRVAVGQGYVAEHYLTMQFPDAIPVPVRSAQDALRFINEGSVDLYYGALSDIFFMDDATLREGLEIKHRVFYSSGWSHIAIRSDWPLVKQLFDRFISRSRIQMDPLAADVLSEKMSTGLTPLTVTPDEADYLGKFSTLRVGTVHDSPLLNDIDERGNHVGISSEFTSHVAYQLGLAVELSRYANVDDMLIALHNDEIDIIPYFAITEERQRTMLFTKPYMYMPWMALGRTNSTLFWDLGSLRGMKLALRKKHPVMPLVRQNYPDIEIVVTDDAREAVDTVAAGKADATIETKVYVNRLLTQGYASRLQVLGEVSDDPGGFAFAIDPAKEKLVPILDRALASMSADVADRVIRRWVAVDFEPERRLRSLFRILVPFAATLGLFLLAALYWNRKIAMESKRRLQAERQLVDMTDRLQTGVFQIRQYPDLPVELIFANHTTREMSRLGPDNTPTMRCLDFVDEADREHIKQRYLDCLKNGDNFHESFRFDFPDGSKGWILSKAYCRVEEDGARVWTGYLFDLTSERMMLEDLNAMLLARDELTAMASHELRTPMQSASQTLESIDTGHLASDVRRKLENTKSVLDDLNQLVGDILELTSLSHHSAILSKEAVDFHELISTVCQSFALPANKKGLELSVNIDSKVPRCILGDALRIKQVLYNVVGNAIKYTDDGSVTITAGNAETEEANHSSGVTISVADTGIGIPADKLLKVFEPFAMVGPSSRRSSGLGLALSDKLLAVMGGSISVTSIYGEGSNFLIQLPVEPLPDQAIASSGNSTRTPTLWNEDSETILLVDDNIFARETTASLLVARGWNVLQAEGGSEALDMLSDTACRAVVTDQQMPVMTGLQLAAEIKQRSVPYQPRPVLILMTGGMRRSDSAQAFTDFDAMLFKPVKVSAIEQTIADVISRSTVQTVNS